MKQNVISINKDAWSLVNFYLTPILPLFSLPNISEICVNKFDEIFISQNGIRKKTDIQFADDKQVETLVKQIANVLDQIADFENPILDGFLSDGSRVCCVINPVSKNTVLSFRIFSEKKIKPTSLIKQNILSESMLSFLQEATQCRSNILISGSTGSGKTTLLNILSDYIPSNERIITVEDTKELNLSAPDCVSLEAPIRRNNKTKINMSQLIKTCLRLNPDRIIVGEIRDGDAALTFLNAINTGHCATCTIHANSAKEAINRMQMLIASEKTIPHDVIKEQILNNINLLIHIEMTPVYGRRITEIIEIVDRKYIKLWNFNYQKKTFDTINSSKKELVNKWII